VGHGACGPETYASRMPRVLFSLKATTIPGEFFGRGGEGIRRGVRPWHARRGRPRNLGGPRLSSKTSRPCGEPVTRLRRTTRWRAHVSSAIGHRTSARHEVGHRQGEPEPWPKEAGSRRAAYERGRRGTGHPWTRPSKGGPCWCDLLKGPMSNALTLSNMSPGLQEVVGREVAMSHISGGAGWWKSPCPDLVRGRVRVTARPTLQALLALPPGYALPRRPGHAAQDR
jgi:hypothetical protein